MCDWYALCDRTPVGKVAHPALGAVLTCERCAEKHDLAFTDVPDTDDAEEIVTRWLVTYRVDGGAEQKRPCLTVWPDTDYTDFPAMIAVSLWGSNTQESTDRVEITGKRVIDA